ASAISVMASTAATATAPTILRRLTVQVAGVGTGGHRVLGGAAVSGEFHVVGDATGPGSIFARSAAANAPQLGKRPVGSFAMAFARTPSTPAGKSGRRSLILGGASYRCPAITASQLSPRK